MSEPTFGAPKKTRLSRNKKLALFAVGGIGGLGLIIWYRNRQANASNTANAATANNTGGIDPNAIDPNTGIPYSEEGYGAAGTPGLYGGYNPLTGGYNPGPGNPTVYSPTNGTWAIEAEQYLVSLGYDPTTVATALGLYLAGRPLSQDEYDIVTAAIGFEGNPPNGAPTPILSNGGGGPPGVTVTVPNVVGLRDIAARPVIIAKGFRYDPDKKGQGLKGAAWIVESQNPAAGRKAKVGSMVSVVLNPKNPAQPPPHRKIGPVRRGK